MTETVRQMIRAMRHHRNPSISPAVEEEALARLADGTLSAEASSDLRARVERSPQLQARLREQERAVALARATTDVTAPASLHTAIDGLIEPDRGARRTTRRTLRRPRLALLAVLVVAAAVAAVVFTTGRSAAPTVGQTAQLALAAATSPAPGADSSNRSMLSVRAAGTGGTNATGGIPFPSYVGYTGWQATGLRRDTLHGQDVTTVFYRSPSGARVGYSIVGGSALKVPTGHTWTINGTRYVVRTDERSMFVTWRRDGHTCVIASRSVAPSTLLRLATASEQAT